MDRTVPLFCHLDSPGLDTNLQFHSLEQARCLFKRFKNEVEAGILSESRIRERAVFITSALGLSLSQLLGQNVPPRGSRVGSPKELLSDFLETAGTDDAKRANLEQRFGDFIDNYDAIRHFGPPKHEVVAQLDFAKTQEFFFLTREIWNIVLGYYGRKNRDRFSDSDDIDEILEYEKDKHWAEEGEHDSTPV
ncbi:MAG: hypothetical protein ABIH26_03510 [Candidatus Eisenbacteria bacterium]